MDGPVQPTAVGLLITIVSSGQKELVRRLMVLGLALAFPLACGASKNDQPPPVATGGTGAGPAVYDEDRAIESCQNACAPYAEACGADDCGSDCDTATRLSNAENCPDEFYAYYDCIAAADAADFDCDAGDTVIDNPVASCGESWVAYSQCRRTRGFPCAAVMRNSSVCIALDPELPDWGTCKVDVEPPDGCVPLDGTDYCCPAGS